MKCQTKFSLPLSLSLNGHRIVVRSKGDKVKFVFVLFGKHLAV